MLQGHLLTQSGRRGKAIPGTIMMVYHMQIQELFFSKEKTTRTANIGITRGRQKQLNGARAPWQC